MDDARPPATVLYVGPRRGEVPPNASQGGDRMRKLTTGLAAVVIISSFAAPSVTAASVTVGSADDRVTQQTYVRHDGGIDAAIELCNSTAPEDFGNLTQNNEPFSVV